MSPSAPLAVTPKEATRPMDVLLLSRLQFAAATFFHFLFVPLTLGFSVLIAIMETVYVRTGDEEYQRIGPILGKDFSYQLCHRDGDRHNPGVPVRN